MPDGLVVFVLVGLVVDTLELPEGELLLAPLEEPATPGPPFTPVAPLPVDVVPGVCADTPPAFWHAPLTSKV